MLEENAITDSNSAQGRIIFSLWQKDNVSIVELARRTALGKTTLPSMQEQLEQAEYIIKDPDKEDKRKIIVSLTEKSKQLKEKYEDVSRQMIYLFYKGLREDEIDVFGKTLRHILSNLNKYEEENR